MNRLWIVLSLVLMPVVANAAPCAVQQVAGEKTAKLTWTNVDTDVTHSVNILRGTQPGVQVVVANVPYATAYQETVPAFTVDTTFYYRVQAVGGGGNVSAPSSEVCKAFFSVPPAPAALTIQ